MRTWCGEKCYSSDAGHCAYLLLASAPLAHDPITTKLLWTQEISRIVIQALRELPSRGRHGHVA